MDKKKPITPKDDQPNSQAHYSTTSKSKAALSVIAVVGGAI